jgi:hypothetical protein
MVTTQLGQLQAFVVFENMRTSINFVDHRIRSRESSFPLQQSHDEGDGDHSIGDAGGEKPQQRGFVELGLVREGFHESNHDCAAMLSAS